jgi:hypothetical protein
MAGSPAAAALRSAALAAQRRNRTLGHPWVNESDRPEAALGDECGDRPRWVRSLAAGGGSGNGGSGCWAPRRLRSTMMPLWLLAWRELPCWISGLTSVKWLTRSGGLLAPFRPPPSLAQSRSLVFLGDLVHAGWMGASVKPVFWVVHQRIALIVITEISPAVRAAIQKKWPLAIARRKLQTITGPLLLCSDIAVFYRFSLIVAADLPSGGAGVAEHADDVAGVVVGAIVGLAGGGHLVGARGPGRPCPNCE